MARRRDKDDDDVSIRKKSSNTLLILLAVGGVGLVLLMCVTAIGIGVAVALLRDDTASKLPGSWKGRFQIGNVALDTVYTFNADGTFREQTTVPFGRGVRVEVTDGRWQFRDGKVEINWNRGTVEKAVVVFTDPNTMNYRIVEHTDIIQVGASTTFRRQ
jgi:hypothetical protein